MDKEASPFVGLMPYSEEHAEFFFGRDGERDNIIANLMGARLTLLYGPSGVGKSSVLRAGVAHYLRQRARRSVEHSGSLEFVVVVFNSWGDDPVAGLIEHIANSARMVMKGADAAEPPSPPRSLSEALRFWSERTRGEFLIILDQFEEYLFSQSQQPDGNAFDVEFPRALNDPGLRVSFLISVREDTLGKLDRFKSRIPDLFSNYLRIEHLSEQAAREAIEGPIGKYNDIYGDGGERFSVEAELVSEVCRQVRAGKVTFSQPGGGAAEVGEGAPAGEEKVETPFLQLVMERLWSEERMHDSRRLRLKTLKRLKGADHIVKTHLDNEMAKLTPAEQDIAANVFYHLVTPTGSKISHTIDDLAVYTRLKPEQLIPVLEELSGNVRILRPISHGRADQPINRYEIFHDVLTSPILDWRLRYVEKKMQEEAERKLQAERAGRQRRDEEKVWQEEIKRKRERRKARQRTVYSVVITMLFVFGIVLTLYINYLWRVARSAQRETEAQRVGLKEKADIVDAQDRAVTFFHTVMRGHTKQVNVAAFSPDGRRVATASSDNTARLWDTATGLSLAQLAEHTGPVVSLAFSPEGKRLVTAGEDGKAVLWEFTDNGPQMRPLVKHTAGLNNAVFSPDGNLVATSSDDGTACLWDARSGELRAELKEHSGGVNHVTFSRDGTRVVTASVDRTARVWNVSSGQRLALLEGHVAEVRDASFNRNGTLIVTASADYTARIWEAQTGQLIRTLSGHDGPLQQASFSSDGALILTASSDRTARIWDMSEREKPKVLQHADEVFSAAFDDNGIRVITASRDYTARVWEAAEGKELFVLRGHTGMVNSAVFNGRGDLAVTASGDTTARVWNIEGAGGLRITELALTSDPPVYNGPCPARIKFRGTITVAGTSGTVTFRFVRRGGEPGDEQRLVFDSPGTREVSTVWKFGGKAAPSVGGIFFLEILSPQRKVSEDVAFRVNCEFPRKDNKTEPESDPTPPARPTLPPD